MAGMIFGIHGTGLDEFTYDRSQFGSEDNVFIATVPSGNSTINFVNTVDPISGTDFVELNQHVWGDGIQTVNLGESTKIKIDDIAYSGSGRNFVYNLGDNSTLSMVSQDTSVPFTSGLDLLLNSDASFTFNFPESGAATLEFGPHNFEAQNFSYGPVINGFKAGDQIIVANAKTVELIDEHIVFRDASGKAIMEIEAPNIDINDLNFNVDENKGITVNYACYLEGTHISTPDGESKVEDLKAGDKVLTASGGVATVKWLGYRTLYKNRIPEKDAKRAFPILFKNGCIADNVPHRDLVMSPGHHVFFDGNLVPAMALVNGISIVQQFEMQSFQYFHVELEQFDILLAEGVPAESYVDTGNRNMFQNAAEVAMNPDFGPAKRRPKIERITVVREGPVVEAIRTKLIERSNRMQYPADLQKVG